MSCSTTSLLSQGKAFEALSERDQIVCIVQQFVDISGVPASIQKEFQGFSERDQWLCIAILLAEISAGGASDPDPNSLLSGASDFQGASTYDGLTAINQQVCNA